MIRRHMRAAISIIVFDQKDYSRTVTVGNKSSNVMNKWGYFGNSTGHRHSCTGWYTGLSSVLCRI